MSKFEYDPLVEQPATHEDIKIRRKELEESPIKVDGHFWQCDAVSMSRMEERITYWAQFGDDFVNWRTADNQSVPLNAYQLAELRDAIRSAKALRMGKLYNKALQFKGEATLNRRDIAVERWN